MAPKAKRVKRAPPSVSAEEVVSAGIEKRLQSTPLASMKVKDVSSIFNVRSIGELAPTLGQIAMTIFTGYKELVPHLITLFSESSDRVNLPTEVVSEFRSCLELDNIYETATLAEDSSIIVDNIVVSALDIHIHNMGTEKQNQLLKCVRGQPIRIPEGVPEDPRYNPVVEGILDAVIPPGEVFEAKRATQIALCGKQVADDTHIEPAELATHAAASSKGEESGTDADGSEGLSGGSGEGADDASSSSDSDSEDDTLAKANEATLSRSTVKELTAYAEQIVAGKPKKAKDKLEPIPKKKADVIAWIVSNR